MQSTELFWEIAEQLMGEDERVVEGTIMQSRCLRVGKEFLALGGYKDAGLVVKLPRQRVDTLVAEGVGQPFGPAGKIFKEWVSIPNPDRETWLGLMREGIDFVTR